MINKKPLNVAYSRLEDRAFPWNSAEFFAAALELGFDGVKGDVAMTADLKPVMCHDSFFDFDENGRVLEPGKTGTGKREISDMTLNECLEFEYSNEEAAKIFGYHPHVADLEQLIKICSEKEKVAYITLRDQQIEACVNETYRLLEKYGMVNNCIVNSFSFETLAAIKAKDPSIRLSLVYGPDMPIEKSLVDQVIAMGNCVLCVFWFIGAQEAGELYNASREALEYALANGVELHLAHGVTAETYNKALQQGFTGFQCLNAALLENLNK